MSISCPGKHLPHHTPLAAAIATCLALGTGPAVAATYTVTNTSDGGPGSLRNAITNNANTNGTADTINFAAALNGQTITLTGGQIDTTDTAALTIDASSLANGITISGNNASRIFGVTENQPLTLNKLTLTQGRTTANSSGPADCDSASGFTAGGAICAEGDLVLIDTTVSNSQTTGNYAYGGGFWARGDATLTNSTVSDNSTAGDGARGGGFGAFGDATLNNSTVSGNSTAGYYAGGGGFLAFGDATLNNSIVSGNSTAGYYAYGGGFYAANTTLTNSTVSDNSTAGYGAYGGGFLAANTTLTNSTVSGNSTAGYGARSGGFLAYGNTTLNNSTVSGNSTAGYGARGGGFLAYGNTTLTNSTVSGNSTAGYGAFGGGFGAFGDATLNNSTVSQNQANHAMATGDGIYIYNSIITLNSTILSDNGADNIAGSSPTVNATNSLFGDAAAEINGTNTNNVFNNTPGLAALADNGCATPAGAPATAACVQTHALLPTSPALDTGDNPLALTTDQRGTGFPRVLNGQADIGAFERAPGGGGPGTPTPIPALNAWMLGLLSLLLGFVTWFKRRRAT